MFEGTAHGFLGPCPHPPNCQGLLREADHSPSLL